MIAALFSAAVSTPAFADSSNDLADAGLIFEMDNSQSVELAVLSSEEMKSTEGAWVPYAIGGGIGFVSGNYSYLTNAAFSPTATWSWGSYAKAVGMSTIVGAINPVNSIRSAAVTMGSSYLTTWQFR